MRTTRTYYEILGLPRDATLAQIKRRYKQLVRKYHPDVAADKATAHRLFIQIAEAYNALSDPVSRRAYDANLAMERPRQTASARTSSAWGGAARTQAPPGDLSAAAKHVKDAQWSFIQRRFTEAVNSCKAALEIDQHNSRAYAVLGDIFRVQGRPNTATKFYGYALQYNPTDRETRRKLDRLIEKRVVTPKRQAGPVRVGQATSITMNGLWWGVAFFVILMIYVHPGEPIVWLKQYIPQVSLWSWNLVGLMAAASAIIGMLLSINGILDHPDDELVFEANWAVIPTGLILMVGSGFFFLGAAGFYIAVGLLQGSVSKSVLTVFGAVVGVVLFSSLVYVPAARYQVMLFGGNVSFLSMLVGWYIGSLFKPLSSL